MDATVGQVNRGLIRPVTIAAALIGTVEALIWTGFSLVSILYYNGVLLIDDDLPPTSYRRALYEIFLDGDAKELSDKLVVTPNLFSLFMYIYLVLSFVWLISSLYMFWAMTRNKWSEGFVLVGGWAGITIIISLLDAAVMSLVVADFVTVQDAFASSIVTPTTPSLTTATGLVTTTTEPVATTISTLATTDGTISSALTTLSTVTVSSTTIPEASTAATTLSTIITEATTLSTTIVTNAPEDPSAGLRLAIGADFGFELTKDIIYASYVTVMSLAARGYILWIVNVIFACVLMKFAYDLKKEEAPSLLPILDAYASGTRPWNNLYEQTDISNGFSNEGFKGDNEGSMFPRSDSFINSDPSGRDRNPLSSGANPYDTPVASPVSPNSNVVNGRVAKIGKSGGRRTPPQNVPPPSVPSSPFIPDPDYTPPPSPRPKSVLRPKSNYVL